MRIRSDPVTVIASPKQDATGRDSGKAPRAFTLKSGDLLIFRFIKERVLAEDRIILT